MAGMSERDRERSAAAVADSAIVTGDASSDLATAESSESAGAARPAWFAGPRRSREAESAGTDNPPQNGAHSPSPPPLPATQSARSATRRRLLIVTDGDDRPRTWREEVRFQFGRLAACGYGLSLLLHSLVLAILSIVIAAGGSPGPGGLPIVLEEGDGLDQHFEELPDTRLTTPEFEARQETRPLPITPLSVHSAEPLELQSQRFEDDRSQLLQKSIAQQDAPPVRGEPGNRQTRGSFTVWTEPEAPAANQPYFIYIEMRVPRNVRRLNITDLSGTISGTDNYLAEIPSGKGYTVASPGRQTATADSRVQGYRPATDDYVQIFGGRGLIETEDGIARIRVQVPGARMPAIRDTIRIRSKLLREEQTLEIEFQSRSRS